MLRNGSSTTHDAVQIAVQKSIGLDVRKLDRKSTLKSSLLYSTEVKYYNWKLYNILTNLDELLFLLVLALPKASRTGLAWMI